jgi:hypothetical protein
MEVLARNDGVMVVFSLGDLPRKHSARSRPVEIESYYQVLTSPSGIIYSKKKGNSIDADK